ncbi:16S rRNA processing protein RimM [Desulfocicer vacuolatum DSM 3385]|uniref:Ribosome maturation factor RimM n=1 Tax=Desulfocicer vacuolatum DSM 3385 TaxID=1121400 RepID=A0A1W2CSC6_9BACT|nr:ribosome maturation factor RimM [Desulfocicer vacuolatum]SMC88103.1 16S rRNA processing protein RimM [Desulfocicer vacuolatum DSM 3385]
MDKADLLIMGHVTGVHGLKGYIKVKSHAASSNTFDSGVRIFVGPSVSRGKWHTIVKTASHKKGLRMLLADVDINAAQTLVGMDIFIPRADLPDLDDDTYYWNDLIGMTVNDINQGVLGTIEHVMATGSNDVFVVTGGTREVLVPSLAHVVLSVDLESRTMTVDLPEGL